MGGAQVARHLARVARLVERRVLEPYREAPHVAGRKLRHRRRHCARVNSAAQENTERDVADELQPDRLEQRLPELVDQLRLGPTLNAGAAEVELPVLPLARLTILNHEHVAGAQL